MVWGSLLFVDRCLAKATQHTSHSTQALEAQLPENLHKYVVREILQLQFLILILGACTCGILIPR